MEFKRDSVASNVSEFSFEQNEDVMIHSRVGSKTQHLGAATVTTSNNESSSSDFDYLIREKKQLTDDNLQLRKKVLEQDRTIAKLRLEISQLQETISSQSSNIIPNEVPSTPTSSEPPSNNTSSTVEETKPSTPQSHEVPSLDIPSEEETETIIVPIRSSQRNKPSPLRPANKSPRVETRRGSKDYTAAEEAKDTTLITSANNSTLITSADNSTDTEEKSALKKALVVDTSNVLGDISVSSDEDEDINTSHLSTPVRSSGANIDWDSAFAEMENLDSTPEVIYLKSPPKLNITSLSSINSTPYRGRISSGTPSPSKNTTPSNSTNDITKSVSLNSSTSTVNHNNLTNTELAKNKPQKLSLTDSDPSPFASKASTPISPIRYATLSKVQQERSSGYSSTPTTPTNSITNNINHISLRSGGTSIYESTPSRYEGSPFSQSQPQQLSHSPSYASLGSSSASQLPSTSVSPTLNNQSTFSSQQSPTTISQTPSHQRYPSDVPLFVQVDQLSTIKPYIISTISSTASKKNDDPVITIAALDRQSDKEIWRFKKTYSQFIQFDTQIRGGLFDTFSVPPLPDRGLFLSNVPSKVDSRRSGLTDYFMSLFHIPNIPGDVAYKLARFVSLDIVNLLDEVNTDVSKEGWLLRKSKGLGNNWKACYGQIDGPFMNIYETNPNVLTNSKPSVVTETIRLTGAQIGRQPDNKGSDDKNGYRHAFAIMELKKGSSGKFNKFVFCGETDTSRDEWIQTLLTFSDGAAGDSGSVYSGKADGSAAAFNTIIEPLESPGAGEFSSVRYKDEDIDEVEEMLAQKEKEKEIKRQRKKSFFPFVKKHSGDDTSNSTLNIPDLSTDSISNIEKSLQAMNLTDKQSQANRIFRNESLKEIISLSPGHMLYGFQVPSIIYRCLTLLTDCKAVYEEGIFRLSGSAALIKQLREQFDTYYDVDFNTLPSRPDINTVAGLLKLWFRELPTSIIPREIQMHLKNICDQNGKDYTTTAHQFKETMSQVPPETYAVLYVLFKFLNQIVLNCEVNKMNLRNLCIVFSPTLNLQVEVLVPLFLDFSYIFEGGEVLSGGIRSLLDGTVSTF